MEIKTCNLVVHKDRMIALSNAFILSFDDLDVLKINEFSENTNVITIRYIHGYSLFYIGLDYGQNIIF